MARRVTHCDVVLVRSGSESSKEFLRGTRQKHLCARCEGDLEFRCETDFQGELNVRQARFS